MFRKIAKNIIDGWIQFESLFVQRATSGGKKRVLLFRKDTLGDYLLFYPALKMYREKFKDAEITLVITSLFQSLAPLVSDFEHVIWFDAKKFSNNFFYRRKFLLDLKRKGFDITIYTSYSREPMGNLMIAMTTAPEKICTSGDLAVTSAVEREESKKIYTKVIDIPDSIISEVDKNMHLAEKICENCEDNKNAISSHQAITFPTISIDSFDTGKKQADTLLDVHNLRSRPYVIFFPGSGTRFKVWPTEKFAKIADYFLSKNIVPVLCGTKGEKSLIAEIINKMDSIKTDVDKMKIVNLCGQTDLPTMGHLLKHSVFYFGSDNGIAHLSAALTVPVICLLGGGFGFRFFPYGDPIKNRFVIQKNAPCWNDNWACAAGLPEGGSAPCVRNIDIEDVKREIDILLTNRA